MKYKIGVCCENCLQCKEMDIEYGSLVKDTKCFFCGCATLSVKNYNNVNDKQRKLLDAFNSINLQGKSLRQIGGYIGVQSAQIVKYHLTKLCKNGYMYKDGKNYLLTDKGKYED